MKNVKEKFFKTFDIQPYDRYLNCKNNKEGECLSMACQICDESEEVLCYPDITDTILLKLICVCSWYDTPYLYQCMYDSLPDTILKMVMERYGWIPNVYIKNKFKKQIQKVFQGEENEG